MTSPKTVVAGFDPSSPPDDRTMHRQLAEEFASTCHRALRLQGEGEVDWADDNSLLVTWDLGSGSRGYDALVAAAKRMDQPGAYLSPQPWGLKVVWDDVSQALGLRGNRVSAECQAQNRERAPLAMKEDAESGDWPALPLSRDADTWIRECQRFLLTLQCDFDDVREEWRARMGKDLRSRTIRLAAENAEIRPHLLRLLKP